MMVHWNLQENRKLSRYSKEEMFYSLKLPIQNIHRLKAVNIVDLRNQKSYQISWD
jgi:hypothetical protein